MKKNLVIFGAGGLGRETAFHIANDVKFSQKFQLIGFCDDTTQINTFVNDIPILGGINDLKNYQSRIAVIIAIANPKDRYNIFNKLIQNKNIEFPTFISEKIPVSNSTEIGQGSIILPNSVITTNIKLGNFNIIDVGSTIGHDVISGDFVMVYPGANISGNIELGNFVEVGTGAKILQKLIIGSNVFIGAGSVVTKNVEKNIVVAGVPAKKLRNTL